MYPNNTLKQELSTAKAIKSNLLVEMSVIDGHLWHIAAKFGAFVDELIVSFLVMLFT